MTNKSINCTFCKKSRQETSKMVVSGDYSICDKCIVLFNGLLHNQPKLESPSSPTPTKNKLAKQLNSLKIREFIDQFVVGQDTAKMALCVSIVNHYKRLLYEHEDNTLNKSNIMVVGPSGCGKSLLVQTIAKFLDVPFISIDATTLTEAGYIGQNVDTIITRLVSEANGDVELAEKGIVFLDEIDKIAIGKNKSSSIDAKASGIQSALLKMVEGSVIPVILNQDGRKMPKAVEIDTTNILFICGGAFTELNEIVLKRLKKKKGMGFGGNDFTNTNLVEECLTDDFIEFGMIPEFVGRFPIKTAVNQLTNEELIQILNLKNSILAEYKFYFSIDGIDLDFTPEFIENVATQAKKEKTGVRGLRAICDSIMLPHLYVIPEYQKRNVAKITFFGECIDKKELPKIEIYEKKVVAKKKSL